MKFWLTIIISLLAIAISTVSIMAVLSRHSKPKDTGLTRGLIDSLWMELPRHDVRLRSPGPPPVWEEAWLDTTYWLIIKNLSVNKSRKVEIDKAMYWKCKYRLTDIIDLEADSATAAEAQAKWDADSIKYKDQVKRDRERHEKRQQQ